MQLVNNEKRNFNPASEHTAPNSPPFESPQQIRGS